MKILVRNMRDLPFVFELSADDGSVIRELLAPRGCAGDTADIGTRVDPWQLNRPNLVRRLVSPGGVVSATSVSGGYRLETPQGQVSVTFVREPDDLVYTFTPADIMPTRFARVATTTALAWTAAGSGPTKTLTSPNVAVGNNTVDGVSLAVGDRVLVRAQTDATANGIYVVTRLADGVSVTAQWTRAADFVGSDVVAGSLVVVTEGASLEDTGWLLATNGTIVVDTSPLNFVRSFAPGLITAGEHQALRQLIHFINDGPADGFASGAYREVIGGVFPTSVVWWESAAKTQKIVEKIITRSGGSATNVAPTPVVWNVYVPGPGTGTLVGSVSDTIVYNGAFEVSRTRTVVV